MVSCCALFHANLRYYHELIVINKKILPQNTTTMMLRIAFALSLVAYIYAQDTSEARLAPAVHQNISQTCFGCMCEAASGCDTSTGCNGEVCGPFRITWGYWADSGKPTLNNEPASAPGAWSRCVNDAFCASHAVQGYMDKFYQDCNGDGVINCDDYVRIHRLGGYGCSGPLEPKYENTYKACMSSFSH